MGQIIFPCGCKFTTPENPPDEILHSEHLDSLPPIDIDIYSISMECPATWELFARGSTKGVFQLESYLGKKWAKKVKPDCLEDLAALVALLRPGCLKAMSGDPPKSMTERYSDRKNRMEDTTYFHPALEPILSSTYGVLVYQEQAMRIAVVLAGFNEQEADVLRKAIGKKKADVMAGLEKDFVDGCIKVGLVNEAQAREIFGWIKESQRYSFNKSHAACYGLDAYWTAFCKAHFPAPFYCSYLSGAEWKQKPHIEVAELVNDAKLNDIEICIPDFRDMKDTNYIKGKSVYFSLGNIKGIGDAALLKIQREATNVAAALGKEPTKWNWLDFLIHFSPRVSTTSVNAIIMVGALDYLGMPRSQMLYEYQAWLKLSDKEQEWAQTKRIANREIWSSLSDMMNKSNLLKKQGGACHTEKRVVAFNSIKHSLDNPPHSLTDTADMIAWHEEQLLGAPITCHKVDACAAAATANTTCKEILAGRKGYLVVAVEVVRVRELTTKKGKNPGKKMASLCISDASCSMENVVAFPDVWSEYGSKLYESNTVLIQGEVGKEGGLVIKKVWQI